MKRFGVICVLAVASAGAARADVVPACPVPPGVAAMAFTDLPAAIQKALHDQAQPSARGLFAWSRGTHWVVATEQGAHDPVYGFDVAVDGKRVRMTATKAASLKTVCAVATGLMGVG